MQACVLPLFSKMVSGVIIATVEKLHSSLHGFPNRNLVVLNPRSLSANRSVADGRPHELFKSHFPGDTVQLASDLTYSLQHQSLSLKKEQGVVREWRPLDYYVSRDVPLSRRWPVSEIAEAPGPPEEALSAQGEQLSTVESIEGNTIVDDVLLSEEGQFSGGFKLDLVEGMKNLARDTEALKEAVTSIDYTVSPTPFSPVDGAEAVNFVAICVLLSFAFWLGNYYVPDLIFKDTVFRRESEDPPYPTSRTSGDKNLTENNQESQKGSSED